jgi:hypothetical protein
MRKLIALLCLVTACYRTTEWGSVGEYRGHNSKTTEQQVGEKQTATIDESNGLRATVMSQAQCKSLMTGDHLEEKQESTKQLQGAGWMVVSSLLIGAAGAFGILFAAADANNQDVYGNQLPSRLSSSTRTDLIVAGSVGVLLGIAGVVAVVELPSEKRNTRWIPLEGDPKQVFTNVDPQPCSTPATPVAGTPVHVVAEFAKDKLEYDVMTNAAGVATIDLPTLHAVAGWCGDANVTVTVLDQTWHGPIDGTRAPLEQITDQKARALAESCSH